MYPPKTARGYRKKATQNNGVTTVTTSTPYKEQMGEKMKNMAPEISKYVPQERLGDMGRGGYTGLELGAPKPVKRHLALSENGRQRIGEDHANAKLTDAQVEAMRERYEAFPVGHPEHVGYRQLAAEFGVAKRTARDIVNYNRRNQWAGRWKRVNTKDNTK
jgi:hypothetical protein